MNKSNFRDLGNTILIIIFFLIIIGLIFIIRDPIKFNNCIFGNKIIEGNTNLNITNKCNECVIRPTLGTVPTDINVPPVGPNFTENQQQQEIEIRVQTIKDNINAEILQKTQIDPSSVIDVGNGVGTSIYSDIGSDISSIKYVFCAWKGSYNTVSMDWFNDCSNIMYNDNSCCLTNENIQNNFYINNYILDTQYDICYNGLIFKYVETTNNTISNNQDLQKASATTSLDNTNSSNNYTYIPISSDEISRLNLTFINNRFIYYTTIRDTNVDSLTISSTDKEINCLGSRIPIITKTASFGDCNIPGITVLSNTQQMNLGLARQKCWELGRNLGTDSMLQNCTLQSLPYQECSKAYLPNVLDINNLSNSLSNPPSYTAINNILTSQNQNEIGINDGEDFIGGSSDGLTSSQLQTAIQQATDSLVSSFNKRLDSLNVFSGVSANPEYPNIGKPTYLNMGTCDNNSPYVYNSSCSNPNNSSINGQDGSSMSGGFLYQYQCYPSLTGQFKDCGPPGYQAGPEF
tara:strand:+ start:2939 stop:4492 length:1554 start_codon:yes stop_codon:yes gene_type:complete